MEAKVGAGQLCQGAEQQFLGDNFTKGMVHSTFLYFAVNTEFSTSLAADANG